MENIPKEIHLDTADWLLSEEIMRQEADAVGEIGRWPWCFGDDTRQILHDEGQAGKGGSESKGGSTVGAADINDSCARAELGPGVAFDQCADGGGAILDGHCFGEAFNPSRILREVSEEVLVCVVG